MHKIIIGGTYNECVELHMVVRQLKSLRNSVLEYLFNTYCQVALDGLVVSVLSTWAQDSRVQTRPKMMDL
jgi:hypothetical protein